MEISEEEEDYLLVKFIPIKLGARLFNRFLKIFNFYLRMGAAGPSAVQVQKLASTSNRTVKSYLSGVAPRLGAWSRTPYLGKTLRREERSHLCGKEKNLFSDQYSTLNLI